MSECISYRGEYSEHTFNTLGACQWCGVVDPRHLLSGVEEHLIIPLREAIDAYRRSKHSELDGRNLFDIAVFVDNKFKMIKKAVEDNE